MLKVLASETEKEEVKQDKTIINQLSKTIAESSKVLAEFGLAPPVVSYIKSVISENYFNSHKNNEYNEEINTIKNNLPNAKSALFLKMDNEVQSIECGDDPNRVF